MPRLIRCCLCNAAISSAASLCPKCGQPVASALSGFLWGLLQILIGGGGLVMIGVGLAYMQQYELWPGLLALCGTAVLILAGVMRPPTVRRR